MKAVPAEHEKLRILVVDDDADTVDSTITVLQCFGYEATGARNAEAALAAARQLFPHAVMLDLEMPRHDGYQLARELRQLPGLERMLLIAVSGHGMEQHRRLSLAAGCDHHLLKPVNWDQVIGLLSQVPTEAARLQPVMHSAEPDSRERERMADELLAEENKLKKTLQGLLAETIRLIAETEQLAREPAA